MTEYAYDAWGKALSVTGPMAETVGELNPMRYRGYYYDSETGYYYLQSRYYDPEIGRFINADDITISAILKDSSVGLNLFAYCLNDPINNIDPTGYLVIPRWIVSWIIDALLMAIPFIGFAYAPIKAAAKGLGRLAAKRILRAPLTSFIGKFKSIAVKAVQIVRNSVAKVPIVGK